MEKKFTVSADEAIKWLDKVAVSGHAPTWLVTAVIFLRSIRGKKIEVSVRVIG